MHNYYFDEDHGIAYKVDPAVAALVDEKGSGAKQILVRADVKVTNIKREKVRRTLSGLYPSDQYDLDSAKQAFFDHQVARFVGGAKKISEEEYLRIKNKFEV